MKDIVDMSNIPFLGKKKDIKTGKKRKSGISKFFFSHARRLSLELLNIFINHNWLFRLIGFFNKYIKLIGFVFMVYPANERYALKYVYRRRLPKVMWNPWPCGLLWQNGKLGIMFCVSATNGQYSDPKNHNKLVKLVARMEELRKLLGAERKTFAGIVPGVLAKKNILHDPLEADLTGRAVFQAIEKVRSIALLSPDVPIVFLGGKGFIGRRVISYFSNSEAISIDSEDGQTSKDWPDLGGKKPIVVNITVNNAIEDYLDVIPSGSTILNEVYPEPREEVLERLRENNCDCYHVVGIQAKAFPPFPKAYRGAIPCCAAWPSKKMEVVIRKIN